MSRRLTMNYTDAELVELAIQNTIEDMRGREPTAGATLLAVMNHLRRHNNDRRVASGTTSTLPPEDGTILSWREAKGIEKLFEMGTDQCGIMRLERWPEGIVFWYHGVIAWRSWR